MRASEGPVRPVQFMYNYPLRYRRSILITQSLVLVAMLLAITIPIVIRWVIDVGVLSNNPGVLLGASLIVLVIGGVSVSCLYVAKRIRFGVAGRSVSNLRHDILQRLLALEPGRVREATGGQALARLTTDATAVRGVANGGLFEVVNQIIVAGATFAVCLWLDWRVALIAVLPMIPAAVGTMQVQLRLQKVFAEIRGHISGLLSGVLESLANVSTIKSYGREAHSTNSLSAINESLARSRTKMRMTYGVYNAGFNVISSLTVPLALWFGARAALDGRVSVGGVVALIALIMMLQMNVHMIIMDLNGAFRTSVFGNRLLPLFDAEPAVAVPEGQPVTAALSGGLTADGVRIEAGERTLLAHVSLRVAPGELVAISGPTGSGKSALLHVLARLRDPDDGMVCYDGHDARKLDLANLRRQVICLPQRQWIFGGSLADNVTFAAPDATPQRLHRAVAAAGLGHMPLDRALAAGGPDLSAGERQRVGLARALLADPAVLLLDNPTANLDAETEADLLDTLCTMRGSRTIVVATHHEAVTRIADRVLDLRDGRLAERTATTTGVLR